ncbi:acyl-CoA dehydrogenase [Actinomycetospora sp. NBRC 106375]|nr:acyl-CoA dehydrogenase [Actinomycetospora sp. NBRC 106375]
MADTVDRDARFPREAIDALRDAGLLSAALPSELGGMECSVPALAVMCTTLGRACASTGMIFAMHQAQVLCLLRHARGQVAIEAWLERAARAQWLVASATSEAGVGGDIGRSMAAVEGADPGPYRLTKLCPTLSYGCEADAILATARRSAQAALSDQVLVLLERDDYSLETLGDKWDALGMRGTCSPSGRIVANVRADHIVDEPCREVLARTMVPSSHILWGSVWLGLAADAVSVAWSRLGAEKGSLDGLTVPSASNQILAEIHGQLDLLRSAVRGAATEFEQHADQWPSGRAASAYALRIRNVKLVCSQLVAGICQNALLLCGAAGYANTSEHSVNRHVRDALSALVMVGNDRIATLNARTVLLAPPEP